VTKVASSISTSIGLPLENEQLSFTVSARLVLCPRSIYAKATLGGGVMTQIAGRRMVAEIEGDFVVFLIGARFSKSHPLRSFADLGGLPTIVQYWRSFDHLEAFARDADDPHLAVWRRYWRRVGRSDRTGIWHETYLVRAGEYEAVYGNMPPFGLGKAGRLVPASESSSARDRLKVSQE
jgi:hypothetical protein